MNAHRRFLLPDFLSCRSKTRTKNIPKDLVEAGVALHDPSESAETAGRPRRPRVDWAETRTALFLSLHVASHIINTIHLQH